uniref:Tudor domain-containing protein n=1 Tax=Heliothis virescens TaxID=7102 RepID=A0A2A4JY36_HELVI
MNLNPYDFTVGTYHSVDVTHINNPQSFYVRTIEARDIIDRIEKPDPEPISADRINLGQRVVYKSNVLDKYVRGNICSIKIDEEITCDVFAIDYGCFDKSVLQKDIHDPDKNSEPENQSPGLAIHCRLNLCEPKDEEFPQEVIDAMKFFVGEHTATIIVKATTSDQLTVELRTVDSPRDIATMLGLLHYTTFFKVLPSVSRFSNTADESGPSYLTHIMKYKHRTLNVGDVLHVRVQSGTSLSGFYVAEMQEFKQMVSDASNFAHYCKGRTMSDEDIVPGRPCAVRVQDPDKYERAIIKTVEPDRKAIVQLVDWGKEFESHFSWIRSVVSGIYLDKPILAIYCTTDEDQVWETSLPRFLFPGYDLVIKIMALGDGFEVPHRVNIYPTKK